MEKLLMGLEIKLQDVYMTFKRVDSGRPDNYTFWAAPPPPTKVEYTMVGRDPILIPHSLVGGFSSIGAMQWEADWGYSVLGDSFHIAQDRVGAQDVEYSRCMFELASAAYIIDEPRYWSFSRTASIIFYEALLDFRTSSTTVPNTANSQVFFASGKTWYPISSFITHYNNKIMYALRESTLLPDKWKLQLSPTMVKYLTGHGYGLGGQYWEAYIQVDDTLWTDTHVNYQLDLEFLYLYTESWIDMWRHTWMTQVPSRQDVYSDPPSGHRTSPHLKTEIIRNQLHVAIWKLAKRQTDLFFSKPGLLPNVGLNPGDVTPSQLTQVKALIMFIFANGAIAPVLEDRSYKGSYSQLAKSSPASIAHVIDWPAIRTHFTSSSAVAAANEAFKNMRNYDNIRRCLPNGSCFNGIPELECYKDAEDPIFEDILPHPRASASQGPYPPPFPEMWYATFAEPINVENSLGYQLNHPFYCYWAFAFTPKPALRYAGKIKILLESRFGHNRLNIGFNPISPCASFYFSYRSLLMISSAVDKNAVYRWMSTQPEELVGTEQEIAELSKGLKRGQTLGVH